MAHIRITAELLRVAAQIRVGVVYVYRDDRGDHVITRAKTPEGVEIVDIETTCTN